MYKASEVLNDIYMILASEYSLRTADNLIHPLVWYYSTARMTLDQEAALKRLNNKQKRIVAKKLARSGSDYEVIERVMSYLNEFKAA